MIPEMTVKELLEKLQTVDPTKIIQIATCSDNVPVAPHPDPYVNTLGGVEEENNRVLFWRVI